MVSKNRNPPKDFYLDSTGIAAPAIGPFSPSSGNSMASCAEDPNKKVRKPYTITKSRESWTEPEHDKFLEALQLFDRDWKKIEAFVGSKTVIQIRSHAQKYFLKVQKSGTNEHLPPPRPKRKAAHPYPHKAAKNVLSQESNPLQSTPDLLEPGYIIRPDCSSVLITSPTSSSWTNNSMQTVNLSHMSKGDEESARPTMTNNCCSSTESTPCAQLAGQTVDRGNDNQQMRVLPDFVQVYGFIGSVFDPDSTCHLQKLKKMDPLDVETVLLLMRNLSVNLTSPDFEDHRRLLASYEVNPSKVA